MNNERALTLLLQPLLSEKTSQSTGVGRLYAFKVIKTATKPQIKAAVEQLFQVKVQSVRIVNVKSKPVRFNRMKGRRAGWKKAYVGLAKDQEIDLESTG